MIDESLPTFYLKSNKQSHLWTLYLCQHGNDPTPAYTLRYPDPASPTSKNRYAAALVDPYVPDIIYGEVLIIPEWTQPTLSADAIRMNGGVTPPPEPIPPTSFVIHLYNPDQQVTVHYKPKTWNSPATWSFDMPQHTFREPSTSTLDRTRTDPATADTTPKLRFSWRKDSKLSKDLTCFLSGKTTLTDTRAKSKEPDITLSIFKGLREMTLYEPNLYRVEMEDFKGLEVVLLLGAVTIRDAFFAPMKDSFHLSRDGPVPAPAQGPASMPAPVPVSTNAPIPGPSAAPALIPNPSPTNYRHSQQYPPTQHPQYHPQQQKQYQQKQSPTAFGGLNTKPSPPMPQLQPPTRKPTSPQVQAQQTITKTQTPDRKTKKRLEEEDKARRKRQAEVDKETKRLQKLYGQEEQRVRAQTPFLPPRQQQQPQQRPQQQQQPQQQRPPNGRGGPANRYYGYHHHSPSTPHIPAATTASVAGRPGGLGRVPERQSVSFASQATVIDGQGGRPGKTALQTKKSSFFGLRRTSEETKLAKKRSSMF